jgi:hypothetical protein
MRRTRTTGERVWVDAMDVEPRSARDEKGDADALGEFARLSRAQRDAATAGRFDEVRTLLGARHRVVEQLRGRKVQSGEIEAARASDAETKAALEAEIRRVEEGLARLTTGNRALAGYAVRAARLPAFVDHVR